MPFANNNGIQIYYEIEGAGPPLILGHGMMGSIEDLRGRNYLEGLTQDFQVILFDARGHGKSDKPANLEAYYLQSILKDVLAVLDALGIEKVNYWGYSMGGHTGYGLARYYPERLNALIIGGAGPYGAKDEDQSFVRAVLEVISQGVDQGIEVVLEGMKALTGRLTPQLESRLRRIDLPAIKANIEAAISTRTSYEGHLAKMATTSLLYAGTNDEPTYSQVKRAAEEMPDATFHALQGMNHSEASDAAEIVLAFVKPFLINAAT